jgi:hypothetical protein
MSISAVQPYNYAVPIVKSDTVNYDGTVYSASATQKAIPAEAILVGAAGVVVAIMEDGRAVQFTAVAGQIIPLKTIRVNSTTTSATLMYALYFV